MNNVSKLCDYLDIWKTANMSQLTQYHNPLQSSPIMKERTMNYKVRTFTYSSEFKPCDSHTKVGSVCESLQTLEIHITALE